MTSTAIDALRTARDLEAAGIERKQAEVLAAVGGRTYRAPWIQGGVIVAILSKSKLFIRCLPNNSYSIEI